MVGQWTAWRSFPELGRGEYLDAPLGPGVYELRNIDSGEAVAFGHSPNVALTLAQLRAGSLWERMTGKTPTGEGHVEYRTMAAATRRGARDSATTLTWRRQRLWDRIGAMH